MVLPDLVPHSTSPTDRTPPSGDAAGVLPLIFSYDVCHKILCFDLSKKYISGMEKDTKEILQELLEGDVHVFSNFYSPDTVNMCKAINTIAFEDLPLYLNSLACLVRGSSCSEGVWTRAVALRIKNGGKPICIIRDALNGGYVVTL